MYILIDTISVFYLDRMYMEAFVQVSGLKKHGGGRGWGAKRVFDTIHRCRKFDISIYRNFRHVETSDTRPDTRQYTSTQQHTIIVYINGICSCHRIIELMDVICVTAH